MPAPSFDSVDGSASRQQAPDHPLGVEVPVVLCLNAYRPARVGTVAEVGRPRLGGMCHEPCQAAPAGRRHTSPSRSRRREPTGGHPIWLPQRGQRRRQGGRPLAHRHSQLRPQAWRKYVASPRNPYSLSRVYSPHFGGVDEPLRDGGRGRSARSSGSADAATRRSGGAREGGHHSRVCRRVAHEARNTVRGGFLISPENRL